MFLKYKFKLSIQAKLLQLGIILFLFNYWVGVSYAAPSIAQEYQVKAVFLYNFAYFVQWPRSVFVSHYAPFYICILGEDPFREEIDVAVENEKVNKHAVMVRRIKNLQNVDMCQILFISKSEQAYLTDILAYLRRHPILTVSDIDNFAIRGGMIQFYKLGKRVRFSIAPDTVKEGGLRVNANLLRIARIVRRWKR